MVLGTVLILASLSLFLWNQRENNKAGDFAEKILQQMMEQMETSDVNAEGKAPGYPNPYDAAMTEMEIEGYAYVGYLSIPALELELPVMSEWDYERLKISACRYAGSARTNNLVICAHNYERFFGPIRNLVPEEVVCFIDMDGKLWKYEVMEVETLAPTEVEDMTAGDYDLTLFTCTYSGESRVTVRCQRISG